MWNLLFLHSFLEVTYSKKLWFKILFLRKRKYIASKFLHHWHNLQYFRQFTKQESFYHNTKSLFPFLSRYHSLLTHSHLSFLSLFELFDSQIMKVSLKLYKLMLLLYNFFPSDCFLLDNSKSRNFLKRYIKLKSEKRKLFNLTYNF